MKHPATFTNNQDLADVVAQARTQGCLVAASPQVYRRPADQHDDSGLGRALQQQQPHYVAFAAYLLTAAIREYICSAANRTVLVTGWSPTSY
jgi:hypothetical protein